MCDCLNDGCGCILCIAMYGDVYVSEFYCVCMCVKEKNLSPRNAETRMNNPQNRFPAKRRGTNKNIIHCMVSLGLVPQER